MMDMLHNPIPMFTTGISLLGLFVILIIALNPPMAHEDFPWRKPLVGSIFSLICVFGILAIFFPKQCSETLYFQKSERKHAPHSPSITIKGHHPDCEGFSDHVIHVGNHTVCAACAGLFIGALVALTGTALYFFGGWPMAEVSSTGILIGAAGLLLGFCQMRFGGFIRSMLNAFFVLGAFLILIGIDGLFQSLSADIFLNGLIVFWILTRILLSQWDHRRICSACKSPCGIRESK